MALKIIVLLTNTNLCGIGWHRHMLLAPNLGRTGVTRDTAAVEVSLQSHLLLSRQATATKLPWNAAGGWEYEL